MSAQALINYAHVPGKLKPAILQACLITGHLELNLDMLQRSLLRGDSPFQHMGLDKSRDLLGSDDRDLTFTPMTSLTHIYDRMK